MSAVTFDRARAAKAAKHGMLFHRPLGSLLTAAGDHAGGQSKVCNDAIVPV